MSFTKGSLDVGCAADRPAHDTDAEDSIEITIEITIEMIEAGFDAYYREGGPLEDMTLSERTSMLSAIFSAMFTVWVASRKKMV